MSTLISGPLRVFKEAIETNAGEEGGKAHEEPSSAQKVIVLPEEEKFSTARSQAKRSEEYNAE